MIVYKGCRDHTGNTDHRPDNLSSDKVKAVIKVIICSGVACRKHHDQSKTEQGQRQKQKRNIKISPDVQRRYLIAKGMFIDKDTGEEQVTCKTEENSGLSGQFKEGRKEFEAAGIDRRLGLSYFDNNEADYMEIVQCFYEQGRSQIQTLQELYDKKDWENYKINVHSLKGQSLTIGAKELSKRAKRMQEACEHGDENYIIQNHTELIADYCSILDGLSKYVTVGEEKNPVQKLSAAIDNFDQAEAMKLLEMIKNEMGSSMADSDTQLIADMEAQIELFDFISAAETLKKWGGADNE